MQPHAVLAPVLAAALLLAVSGVPAVAQAPPGVGVQVHATWSDYPPEVVRTILDRTAAAGMQWVRIDVGWSALEEQGKGRIAKWYLDKVELAVNEARARNLNVLLTLWLTPAWANGNRGVHAPPSDPAEYGRIAGWVADHFKGRVQAWQVWNEPNLEDFFTGTDPVAYVQLLRAAYPAIKAADPQALVVLGGPSYNDVPWLQRVYDAGAQGAFDVMSTHPYQGRANEPPGLPTDGTPYRLTQIAAVKQLMDQRGDGAKPIWFTEFGWSTHANTSSTPVWELGVAPEGQGRFFIETVELVRSSFPYVANVFWYNSREKRTGNAHQDGFGLLTYDLRPKPAYTMIGQHLATAPRPAPSTSPDVDAGMVAAELLTLLNGERRQRGLAPLTEHTGVADVARRWSAEMAKVDRLSHNPSLNVELPGDWARTGENVGFTSSADQPPLEVARRLHAMFVASPPHLANIVGDFNQVGVGASVASTGKVWVTVDFVKAAVPTVNAVPQTGGQPQPAPPAAGEQAPSTPPGTPSPQADPVLGAVAVSRELFGPRGGGGRQARHVVLARAEVFADALAGAALTGEVGPLLLAPAPTAAGAALRAEVRAEIDRVLAGSGTVYLLGGTSAVSARTAAELVSAGYEVKRLAGASRVGTALQVAREALRVRGRTGEVLLARADTWPDAVTGGAYAAARGVPLVLTSNRQLDPAVAAFLDEHRFERRWVLGGPGAVSDAVVGAAGGTRIAGGDRTATAVAVAQRLWGRTSGSPGQGYVVLPADAPTAWAHALGYAPYSAVAQRPQLLVGATVSPAVEGYLAGLGHSSSLPGQIVPVGDVPPAVVQRLRQLVGG